MSCFKVCQHGCFDVSGIREQNNRKSLIHFFIVWLIEGGGAFLLCCNVLIASKWRYMPRFRWFFFYGRFICAGGWRLHPFHPLVRRGSVAKMVSIFHFLSAGSVCSVVCQSIIFPDMVQFGTRTRSEPQHRSSVDPTLLLFLLPIHGGGVRPHRSVEMLFVESSFSQPRQWRWMTFPIVVIYNIVI